MNVFGNLIILLALLGLSLQTALAIRCLRCGPTDGNCIENVADMDTTTCSTACIVQRDASGAISRGCLSSIAAPATCTEPDCYQCNTDLCNSHTVCKACDSAQDPDCAQLNNTKLADNRICPADITQCLINVRADKHTERNCATTELATQCHANGRRCKMCDTPNCNTEIFPERPVCYSCSGADCNAVTNMTEAKACLLYEPTLKCYTVGSSATDMQRGCTTDVQAKCTDSADDKNCLLCETDKCNRRRYTRKQLIPCHQCDTQTSADCWEQQHLSILKLKLCKNDLKYYEDDMCRSQLKDNVLYRGCFYDLIDLGECNLRDECMKCSIPGCNSIEVKNSGDKVASLTATLLLTLMIVCNFN